MSVLSAIRPDFLTETEAADYLSLKQHTLAVWRSTGRYGLPFVKIGSKVRYRRDELDAWMKSRTVGGAA